MNVTSPAKTFPDTDIFVIGSGMAALAFAQRAASRGRKIQVIEGGGVEETDANRALTLSDEYGHYHNHWSNHWVRAVGGTSRRWAGYLARLHDGNFNHAFAHARWPISQADLLPHYQQALAFFGRKTEVVTHNQWPLLDGKMALRPLSRGGPLRITKLETFTRLPNVEIQTGHHVVRLESADRQRVDHILIKPDEGDLFRVKILPGQQVVLACGGLGNAQVLMQPQDTTTTGVGNESGYAGKCLMEHPHATCGAVFLTKQFHDRLTMQTERKGLGESLTAFAISDRGRRSESLLDCTLSLHMRAWKNNQGLQFSQVWGTNVVAGTVIALAEQEPVESNAVQLLNERNRAGLLRLRTECVLTGRDLRSIYDTARTLGEWLATNKVGVFKFHNDGIFREAQGGGHTMGTTRMGTAPKNSVCDRNARVHGYSNLHLAGSSLFSSGGAVNPTLTIVALALRLADHLS